MRKTNYIISNTEIILQLENKYVNVVIIAYLLSTAIRSSDQRSSFPLN